MGRAILRVFALVSDRLRAAVFTGGTAAPTLLTGSLFINMALSGMETVG